MEYDFIIEYGSYPVFLAKNFKTEKTNLIFILNEKSTISSNLISETLFVKPINDCQLYFKDSSSKACNILSVDNIDPSLNEVFIGFSKKVIQSAIHKLTDYSRYTNILIEIEKWKKLFNKLPILSEEELTGLWGELFTIYKSDNLNRLLEMWNGPEGGIFDFTSDFLAIEVKTAINSNNHHFSFNQLDLLINHSSGYVFSYNIVKDNEEGLSIHDLYSSILNQIFDKEKFIFLLRCAGFDIKAKDEKIYKKYRLNKNLLIVESKNIPQIRSYDIGISNIRFQSDLSNAKTTENLIIF